MKVALIHFPGSHGLPQARHVLEDVFGHTVQIIWHLEETIGSPDLLVIPGGAAFADYLRPGGLVKASSVAPAIRRFSREGKVLGIGNGFQILCELGVLPGALLANQSGHFWSENVKVAWGEERYSLPVACYYGRYYVERKALREMEDSGAVLMRYESDDEESLPDNIAAITNAKRNVIGLMVRPERAVADFAPTTDGKRLFERIFSEWGM